MIAGIRKTAYHNIMRGGWGKSPGLNSVRNPQTLIPKDNLLIQTSFSPCIVMNKSPKIPLLVYIVLCYYIQCYIALHYITL